MKKLKSFMENLKKYFLVYIVVWLILVILLVAPITYSITNANIEGQNMIQYLMAHLVDNIFIFPITKVFESTYVNDFIEGNKYFGLFYWILVFYAIYKTLPKGGFYNIEHGSSDWCQSGEQYKILSKKNGLLLAKDNFLPVDKPGNVNVLIVGRVRCW